MEKGKLFGVGVGPGDPELMTIKAVRTVEDADVLMLPGKDKKECRAYKIIEGACRGIEDKECIFEPFPMKMDKSELIAFHSRVVDRIREYLDRGLDIAFITIGDTSVYSTFDYIETLILEEDYETERISGIPSFTAAADRLDVSLGRNGGQIHIIPASDDIEEALKLPGTKVFMKTGRRLGKLKEALIGYEERTGARVLAISNCSLPDESVFRSASEIPDDWGYMNLIIVD